MPNKDYNIKLRDLAKLKGLDVGYNQETKGVTIGGQPFDTTGWQNIDGYNMGTKDMADSFMQKYQVPSGNVKGLPPPQETARKSSIREMPSGNVENVENVDTPIYADEINKVTRKQGDAINNFGQKYDLDNDPIYKSLADYQERRMMQLAGRTGSHYDSNTQARIGQANMQLGLQFQQSHEARQLQNIQNLQGQLNTLTGLEDRALKNNTQIYGMALTPQTNDYMTTMQNLTPEQTQFVSQYSDNFAAEINRLPEGDPNRKLLEAGRFQKVINDPVQFRDYLINDYGLSPFQVDGIVFNKKLEEAKLTATNEKEALELQKLMLSVEKAGYDTSKAGNDAQTSFWKNFMAEVEASNISDKLKADLRKTNAEISNINARTQATNLAKQLTQKKIDEAAKGSSPKVYQGFNELVAFVKDGGSMLDWLSTMMGDPDRDGASMGYRVSERFTPEELTGISKLAKSTGILDENDKNEVDPIEEAIADRIRRG